MSNTTETPATTKPWYKSKTVLFAAVVVFIFGGNIAFGWITGQGVSAEQIQAVKAVQPDVYEIIDRVQNGESILNMLGIIVGIVMGLLRAWTNTSIKV